MVVAQLVEQSLPIPEVHGSNPVIGKFTVNFIEKTKRKRKEADSGPFKKLTGNNYLCTLSIIALHLVLG